MTNELPDPPPLPERAALFLDLDGTLIPLAATPHEARAPQGLTEMLSTLALRLQGALAIVSGRAMAEIDRILRPLALPCAGLHGAELRLPDGRSLHQGAEPPAAVRACAEALVRCHAGLLLEDKRAGLALHFRARPELGALCARAMADTLAHVDPVVAEAWQLMPGHAVLELKQRRVSKGLALQALMNEAPFSGRMPVYVGDDVTDEDGIVAAQAAGGFGVRVGMGAGLGAGVGAIVGVTSGATAARHRLADTAAVGRWLGAAAQEVQP